ncbi:hypothetical protein ABLA76_08980 [Xenorhabdus sp. SGI240]
MSNNNSKMEVYTQPNASLIIGQYVIFVAILSSDKPIISLKKITNKNYDNNTQFNSDITSFVCVNNELTQCYYIYIFIIKVIILKITK